MKLQYLLHNSKHHSAIICATGLLSGEKRTERIKTILEENVWLAAKCKNTCVLEEEEITDAILLKCGQLYNKTGDVLSLVALLELGEIGVFAYLLNIKNPLIYNLFHDQNQSVSHLFFTLCESININIFWRLYNQIEALGYSFDIEVFNLALSRLSKGQDINVIKNNMETSGIKANATTYYHFVSKSSSYEEAVPYYNLFKENVKVNEQSLIAGVLSIMINLSPTQELTNQYYQEYKEYYPNCNDSANILIESAYCAKNISFTTDFCKCKSLINNHIEITLIPYFTTYTAKKAKKTSRSFLGYIIVAYSKQLTTLNGSKNEILESYEAFCHAAQLCSCNFHTSAKRYTTLINALHTLCLRHKDIDFSLKLIDIMDKYHIKIHQQIIWDAIMFADSSTILQKMLDKFKLNRRFRLTPQMMVSCIQKYNYEQSEIMYNFLCTKHFPLNIYIYNVLIKKFPFEKALQLLYTMQDDGICPDIQSIQPFFNKQYDKNGLLTVLSIASMSNIKPDDRLFCKIKDLTIHNSTFRSAISDIKYADIHMYKINTQWSDFISDCQAFLIIS